MYVRPNCWQQQLASIDVLEGSSPLPAPTIAFGRIGPCICAGTEECACWITDRAPDDGAQRDDHSAARSRVPEPVVQLYRLHAAGLSYDEIADTLGLPLGAPR
jgi:hypothetical protein